MAGGQLPKELTAQFHHRAIELGLYATNMPASVGGPGCTALQQVLVQEQVGRVTNGLAWAAHTPPQWWVDVATDYQRERWLLPAVRGEKHEAYAITEEFAGSDVSDLAATARRDGDEYVVNGTKWHVTSYNLAEYLFVQAVARKRRIRRRSRASRGRPAVARGGGGPHTALQPSHRRRASHRLLHRRAGAGLASGRRRRPGHDVHPGLVPFRTPDGGVPLCRCGTTPCRRDDRVRPDTHRRRQTPGRVPTGFRDAGRQRDRVVRRPHHALRGGPVHRRRR